ncbi:hypothetical protein BBK82_28135 [Lentzea guizhouensis]|uniref:Uncharacterized protein n=1 Tax=Lentzea guizhouensis TaxID=1586287 RepID=A0A1B2HNP5_9PSEU|nr:hypothetical protein [Lentzea guizhouensis]ANZ39347.1 hypothetical protein BBK82_28135 [Lentzea guizhouensis]
MPAVVPGTEPGVETAALLPELTLLGTGSNQLTRMVRHHVDGDASVGAYEQQRFVRSVHWSSPRTGVLHNATTLASLDTLLPSFHRSSMRFGEGSSVPHTTDPRTSLGYIALAHNDERQVERDEAQLRSIEASFEVV